MVTIITWITTDYTNINELPQITQTVTADYTDYHRLHKYKTVTQIHGKCFGSVAMGGEVHTGLLITGSSKPGYFICGMFPRPRDLD